MKKPLILTVILGVVLLLGTPSFAENALDKLGRGLANTATGWCEYPKQIMEASREHHAGIGATWGHSKGAASALERTGAGVYDLGTFYLPEYDELLVEPEYLFRF